jgi:hypothetical protein
VRSSQSAARRITKQPSRRLSGCGGAPSGTPEGDRLDALATLIDAYEAEHHPIGLTRPDRGD